MKMSWFYPRSKDNLDREETWGVLRMFLFKVRSGEVRETESGKLLRGGLAVLLGKLA